MLLKRANESVISQPYNCLLDEFAKVLLSELPWRACPQGSVPTLVSKHLFNLGVERILLSQDMGPLVLHFVPETICQQQQSHL